MEKIEQLLRDLRSPETSDSAAERLYDLANGSVEILHAAICDVGGPPFVRATCAEVLGSAVPEGVVRLLDLLKDSNAELADIASFGLRWNHAPDIAEPALLTLLLHSSDGLRLRAAKTLRRIGCDLSTRDLVLARAILDRTLEVGVEILMLLDDLLEVAPVSTSDAFWMEVAAMARQAPAGERQRLADSILARMSSG